MTNPARANRALIVLFAINILNFYDRAVLSALTEPVRKEFNLSDTQIGAVTTAFTLLYAVIGVPLGRVADRWSRKKLLASGVTVWSLLTGLTSLATTYGFLVFARLGVAVGEAVCAPVGTSWLGDLFPPHKRARVLGLFMLGVPIGHALSNFFSGPVAHSFGWRTAMVLAAVPAVLLVPALLSLHEPIRGASESRAPVGPQKPVWSILRIPTLWWIIASGALLNFSMYAIGTFLPAFLSRVHGLSLAKSGIATGVVYLSGGVSGGTLAGYLGDFIVQRREDGRLLCAAVMALVAIPFACVGILQPAGSLFVAMAFLALTYSALTTYYGLVYSAIQDIVAPNQRGAAMAIYFMAMYMCGASLGPLLTGKLSDVLAHRAAALAGSATVTETFRATGLQQAMLIIPVLCIALAFVLYMGSRTIITDIARREAIAGGVP